MDGYSMTNYTIKFAQGVVKPNPAMITSGGKILGIVDVEEVSVGFVLPKAVASARSYSEARKMTWRVSYRIAITGTACITILSHEGPIYALNLIAGGKYGKGFVT